MDSSIKKQKIKLPKPAKYFLMFLLLFLASSMFPISTDRYKSIDYHLSSQLKEKMGIENLGSVQSLGTTVIGPYTSIRLQFMEKDKQQVSAKGHQWFWFKPVLSCISSDPSTVC